VEDAFALPLLDVADEPVADAGRTAEARSAIAYADFVWVSVRTDMQKAGM
jgi:hypothetical protein